MNMKSYMQPGIASASNFEYVGTQVTSDPIISLKFSVLLSMKVGTARFWLASLSKYDFQILLFEGPIIHSCF